MFIDFSNAGGGTGPSINVEALSVTENGTYTAPEGSAYSPVEVNVPAGPVGGEGFDFTPAGYSAEESKALNDKYAADIAYTEKRKGEFDPNRRSFFQGDTKLVFAPMVDTSMIGDRPGGNWNSFANMFEGCSSLQYVPLLDSRKNSDFYMAFANCYSLQKAPALYIQDRVRPGMSRAFKNCRNLQTIKLICDGTNPGINNPSGMFEECYKLKTIDTGGKVVAVGGSLRYKMFYDCQNLTDISMFDFTSVPGPSYNIEGMFKECRGLTSIPDLGMVCRSGNEAFEGCRNLLEIPKFTVDPENPFTETKSMFSGCEKITSVPAFDTSKVEDMSNMFSGCMALTSVPDIDTSSAKDIRGLFSGCASLTSVPVLNLSNITDISSLFNQCKSLAAIPALDTSKVENMSSAFSGTAITSVPELDYSKVVNMANMFKSCSKLASIPASFDMSNVKQANYIFNGCTALTELPLLDLSSADFGEVFGYYQNPNLTTLGGFKGLKVTMNLEMLPNLTQESVVNVFSNLYDFTAAGETPEQTPHIRLHRSVFNATPEETKAIATGKGWRIE